MKRVYMDYNATTPVLPEVVEAMRPYLSDKFGNEKSIHQFGAEAKEAVESARRKIATILKVKPEEVYFTSCATESNNIVIKGVAFAHLEKKCKIITSAVEHSAVLAPLRWLEKLGFETVYLPVDGSGLINPDDLRKAIDDRTALVSVMWGNNEVGTIEPIEELLSIAREHGVLFHTDAAQVAGKLAIDLEKVPVDFLSLSAHKFYGPKGVGILFARRGKHFEALIHGGGHERKKRAGTVNVAGAVGAAKALEIVTEELKEENRRLAKLTNSLIDRVLEAIPLAIFNGHRTLRIPNTANISFRGIEGESVLIGLDTKGIAVSSGSACSSADLTVSHVLKAMDVDLVAAQGAVRFSLGRFNTEEDIDYLLEVLPPIVDRLKSFSAL